MSCGTHATNFTKHSRGPLRAISNVPILNHHIYSDREDSEAQSAASSESIKMFIDENQSTTPVFRTRDQMMNSTKSLDLLPSRVGDYKTHCSSKIDIRRHFPVRAIPNKIGTGITTEKFVPTHNSYDIKTTEPLPQNRKRQLTAENIHTADVKFSRHEDDNALKTKNILLTMGSEVKTHPRYCKRQSVDDGLLKLNDSAKTQITSVATPVVQPTLPRLAPICPVPMPSGFPLQLPLQYSSISLPWDRCPNSPSPSIQSQRNVETQTSPGSNSYDCSRGKHRSRRNSAGAQIFQHLRKKFGSLRRAISVDRLNRHSTPNSADQQVRLNLSDDEGSDINKKRTVITSRMHILSSNQANVFLSSSDLNKDKVIHDDFHKLTCNVTRKYKDGSIQVALRRASTQHQFGFFIARDSKGIYVSRLASVKSAVKLWNVFHVGDRVLQVQGLPCDSMTVEDVQNLIRGCELVVFRLKPIPQSNPWK